MGVQLPVVAIAGIRHVDRRWQPGAPEIGVGEVDHRRQDVIAVVSSERRGLERRPVAETHHRPRCLHDEAPVLLKVGDAPRQPGEGPPEGRRGQRIAGEGPIVSRSHSGAYP
jgi:hypothetical protein